jgi:hypothetical protein
MQNLPARVKLQWRRIFLETVKNAEFPAAQKKIDSHSSVFYLQSNVC